MQEEMNSLQKNNTFELIELSKGNKEMKNKWIFKLKKNGEKKNSEVQSQMRGKRFIQKQGIDFNVVFFQL